MTKKPSIVVNYRWVITRKSTVVNYRWIFWSFTCVIRKFWMWKQQRSRSNYVTQVVDTWVYYFFFESSIP